MKLYLDCIQCIQRQALQAARFGGADEETQKKIVRRSLEILLESDWSSSPMEMGSTVLGMVKEVTGFRDPYLAVKEQSNREAQEHVPHVLERIENSDVVISKGQGNYEAFSSQAGIFFLLMAKCELIAGDINQRINSQLKVGDMILWKGDGEMSYES